VRNNRSAVEGWSKTTPDVPKWTKATVGQHITIGGLGASAYGTPAQIADIMEQWVEEADVDGFNLVRFHRYPTHYSLPILIYLSMQGILTKINPTQAYAIKPGSFKDIVELLIPELRRRGLFWEDYAVKGGTYRENFYGKKGQSGPPPDHPAAKYRWKAGVDAADHKIPED